MTVPQEAIDAAVASMRATRGETRFDNVRHAALSAVEAAAPHIAAAERERIRQGAEALKLTLVRPGRGNGPAHNQTVEVVPWDKLADLLTDPQGDPT